MDTSSQKRMAASLLKCGENRVRVAPSKDVSEALTREDVRGLIRRGLIIKVQAKGTSREKARKILSQKKKGRKRGPGSRKGKAGALNPRKERWIKGVRPMRQLLKDLRDSKQIEQATFSSMYRRVKGGFFRNKKHLLGYMKDKELIRGSKADSRPKKATAKPRAKTAKSPKSPVKPKAPAKSKK